MQVLLAALALSAPLNQEPAAPPVELVSTGRSFVLAKALAPERPTLLVFYQETSSADRDLVDQIRKRVENGGKFALRLVRLKSLESPAAKENRITETPALVVYDRFGNEMQRSSKMEEMESSLTKAVGMARIKWVSEQDPEAEKTYEIMGRGRQPVAGIIKTMSLRPELMRLMVAVGQTAHFSNGFLPRRTKEMIATYVSAINHCKF